MKPLLTLLLCIVIGGCATSRRHELATPRDTLGTALSASRVNAVRSAEVIKAYPLGRYIDPSNRRVMHEAHTIYRLESDARWDLRAGASRVTSAVANHPKATAASDDRLQRDELLAELSRQKQTTQAVIEGGRSVSEKLTAVVEALKNTKGIAEQQARLLHDMEGTKARIETLEARLPTVAPKAPQVVPKSERGTEW